MACVRFARCCDNGWRFGALTMTAQGGGGSCKRIDAQCFVGIRWAFLYHAALHCERVLPYFGVPPQKCAAMHALCAFCNVAWRPGL